MIELVDFTKRYGAKDAAAVQGFSMRCRRGTVTGLLGLNGAGKTTVLKAVCARHFATAGAVRVAGVDAREDAERVRLLTGFVSEVVAAPSEYTVAEYLTERSRLFLLPSDACATGASGVAGAKPPARGAEAGGGRTAAALAVERVIAQCSLAEVRHTRLRSLSKGFLERVNFAQALLHNPPVLVLDEPASGLDPAQIVRMRALVKSLLPAHTVLLSTHLMQEVDALCDYVYILHHGRCVAHGTAAQIAETHGAKTLEEAFFMLTAHDGADGGTAAAPDADGAASAPAADADGAGSFVAGVAPSATAPASKERL